MIRDAVK